MPRIGKPKDPVRVLAGLRKKSMVRRSYTFAQLVHRNEKRRSGRPYFEHALEVTLDYIGDMQGKHTAWGVAVVLCHDTLEHGARFERLKYSTTTDIAWGVWGMSYNPDIDRKSDQGRLDAIDDVLDRMLTIDEQHLPTIKLRDVWINTDPSEIRPDWNQSKKERYLRERERILDRLTPYAHGRVVKKVEAQLAAFRGAIQCVRRSTELPQAAE